jgi:rhodanese-related sulfurtransferase
MFGTGDLLVRPYEVPSDALMVDVREPYEWDAGHIPHARHVPIDELAEAVPDLPRDRPIVLVCLGGVRAAFCAAALRNTDLRVYVLEGGLRGWLAAGKALDNPQAYLAAHGKPPTDGPAATPTDPDPDRREMS